MTVRLVLDLTLSGRGLERICFAVSSRSEACRCSTPAALGGVSNMEDGEGVATGKKRDANSVLFLLSNFTDTVLPNLLSTMSKYITS